MGNGCDWYIPCSVLLPLIGISLVLITGIIGVQLSAARWRASLGVATVISFFGPFMALAIWRDKPDLFVPVAALLLLILPVAALVYGLTGRLRSG